MKPQIDGDGYRAWWHTDINDAPPLGLDVIVETGGRHFVATFRTVEGISKSLDMAAADGCNCNGLYIIDTELVVLRTLDLGSIRRVLDELIQHNAIADYFTPCRHAGDD